MNKINQGMAVSFFCLIFCLVLSMPCLCDSGSAVSYREVILYNDDNGIPTGEANAVYQDSDGFIWIGGYGGLQRYDGVFFTQLSGERGLNSFSIRSIREDNQNRLWVGSNEQGVFYVDGREFVQPEPAKGEETKYLSVRCLAADGQNRMWMGTGDGLAYVKDNKIHGFDLTKFEMENTTVSTLSLAGNGILWAVDYSGSLLGIDTGSTSLKYCFKPGELWPEDMYAYSAAVSEEGAIYVGTDGNHVLKITFDGDNPVCDVIESAGVSTINAVCCVSDGSVWFGGEGGMGVLKDGVFTQSNYNHGSFITGIIEDYEHNIWASSSKYGVLKIYRVKVGRLTDVPQLTDKETFTVCHAGDFRYVGYEGGVVVLDKDWKQVESPLVSRLEGIHIHHIIKDSAGKLYLGSFYNGLYVYDPASGDISNLAINGDRCRVLLELKDGTVAVGTNQGVDYFKDGKLISGVKLDVMVLCLLEQEDGTLLCGTNGKGIIAVKNGEASAWAGADSGISGGVILRMAADTVEKDKIFASCGNDMFYGNNKGFEACSSYKLGSGSYLDIFPDGDNIWLFRASGIFRCDRYNFLKGEKGAKPVLFINSGDGVPGPVTANSFSSFENGIFDICTVNGVGILDTADIYHGDVKPKGAVSDIIFSDGSTWDGSSEIKLGNNLSRMTLYLSALTFCDDDATVEYWLEGFDDEPIVKEISMQNEVEYTNLSAGKYKFHLKVISSDGSEGEEQIISFNKAPRFTETIWFPLVIIIVIVAAVWIVMRIRLRNARRKQEEYRKITDETISTISGAIDAKDPYTQGHSRRVAEFSVAIAKELGLKEEDIERLRYIALLHDIGKIGVPDNILKKPDRLTDDEFEIIKMHTSAGGEILKNFKMLPGVAEGALYHHERYDGSGYCYKLKGEDIPLFARIIAVADAYDAMNSSRCYRKSLDKKVIISELENGKGKQFDPALADIALKLINDGRFDEIVDN